MRRIILIEPFNCGSHSLLCSFIEERLKNDAEVLTYTLPGKKWHWKLRCSSLWAENLIPPVEVSSETTLVVSSMFNLSEFLSLRPEFHQCRRILYMHENQLNFPSQYSEKPDVQFGWIQMLSCLTASLIAWNSLYNLQSFIHFLPSLLRSIPDKLQRPNVPSIVHRILSRSTVVYLPITRPLGIVTADSTPDQSAVDVPLTVIWNHRWEFDKNPETFFSAIRSLLEKKVQFRLIVCGESFAEIPKDFADLNLRSALIESKSLIHWGYAPSKEAYFEFLRSSDIVVSTSYHEFFGISVVEAIAHGCYPLCVSDLSYLELLSPTIEEKAQLNITEDLIQRILSAKIENSSESSWKGGQGSGGSYHPPKRDMKCPHLVSLDKFASSLEYLLRNPRIVRNWKLNPNREFAGAPKRDRSDVEPSGYLSKWTVQDLLNLVDDVRVEKHWRNILL